MNKKRHTRGWRLCFCLVFALAAPLLVTCAVKPPVARVVPEFKAPPSQKSAAPTIAEARGTADKSAEKTERARQSVDRADAAAARDAALLGGTLAELSRLRVKKSATDNELAIVYAQLVEVDKNRSILREDLAMAKSALADAHALGSALKAHLGTAEASARAKDAEADELRRLLASAEQAAKEQQGVADANAKLYMQAKSDFAKQEGKTVMLFYVIIVETAIILLGLFLFWIKRTTLLGAL